MARVSPKLATYLFIQIRIDTNGAGLISLSKLDGLCDIQNKLFINVMKQNLTAGTDDCYY